MLQFKRGKRKILADYKTDDIYKFYKTISKKPVSKSKFRAVLKDLFPELIKMIIFRNFDFRFQGGIGNLSVRKRKVEVKLNEDGSLDTSRLSINWKKTKKYWQELYPGKTAEEIKAIKDKPVIRELNDHTDGYRVYWNWDKRTSTVPNQIAYKLDMNREYDRLLSGAVRSVKKLDFYE